MLDLSLPKLLILAVIALVVFGPNELPALASRAGRALRELRRIADGAQADLRDGLGPEFADFDIADLNPKRFVHKHLLSDMNEADPARAGHTGQEPEAPPVDGAGAPSGPGGKAPFDAAADAAFDLEAT